MDDYTVIIRNHKLRNDLRKSYILKYKVIEEKYRNYHGNKKIVIYLANGRKIVLPYSNEVEEEILVSMDNNVYGYDVLNGFDNLRKRNIIIWLGHSLAALLIGFTAIDFVFLGSIIGQISPIILIGAMIIVGGCIRYKRKLVSIYNDYKKSKLFLENEEMINQAVNEKNKKLMKSLTVHTKDKIVTKPDGEIGFTINSIDKMSLEELKKLLSIIQKKRNFAMENSDYNNESLDCELKVESLNGVVKVLRKKL